MRSSILLSEKENSVTPEPNVFRGKSSISDIKIENQENVNKPLNSVDGGQSKVENGTNKRKTSSLMMLRPEIRTRKTRVATAHSNQRKTKN